MVCGAMAGDGRNPSSKMIVFSQVGYLGHGF